MRSKPIVPDGRRQTTCNTRRHFRGILGGPVSASMGVLRFLADDFPESLRTGCGSKQGCKPLPVGHADQRNERQYLVVHGGDHFCMSLFLETIKSSPLY